ncbi:Acireductone dioxygenase [Dichomitus squalens]|uniref:Acireductone dioxygenase n=1 Tax=Dichomitus squalens TaxID=114155 RepID=A0A4Q9PD73_9APHY|nr:Acireductone dioxygenase [Dichomitus squalens]TBU52005.1 Acireductone dioxygenase [Dichomitus squalens]
MRAYYHDESNEHPTARHDSTGEYLDLNALKEVGVLAFVNQSLENVDAIALERGYVARDEIRVSKEGLGDGYEAKIKAFYEEHLHEDEEIRYIREGSGYFDVRSKDDSRWIRIHVEKNDLIIVPAGIYHRFTLDSKNAVRAVRLFKEAPKWIALPREPGLETNPYRQQYVSSISA